MWRESRLAIADHRRNILLFMACPGDPDIAVTPTRI